MRSVASKEGQKQIQVPLRYLGIIDKHAAPLVQLFHYLQNSHLNIHLHTLLNIRHLADPGEDGSGER